MNYLIPLMLLLLALPAGAADYGVGERLAPSQPGQATSRFRKVTWDDLLPAGWDPSKAFEGVDLSQLDDADPRAEAALEKMRAMWNEAPTNPAIDGQAIRIPGFMVPLEFGQKEVKEFLLVPYFGACIHVPPPPANQIIHVLAARPYTTNSYMDAVWVEGTIEQATSDTDMGGSGYRMRAEGVEPYEEPP